MSARFGRSNRLITRGHKNSPRTRLPASNRMMLRQSQCAARFQPQGKPPLDSLSASACPQRKDLGHSPVFAIGPRAVWDSPAASCRPLASSPRLRCRSPRPAPPVLVQFCCPCLWSSPSPCCPGLCPDSPVALPVPCPSVFVSVSLRCSCPAGLCPAHPLRRFLSLDLPSPGPLSSSLPSPCSPVSVPRTTASITLPKWH